MRSKVYGLHNLPFVPTHWWTPTPEYSIAKHVNSQYLAETPEKDISFKILKKYCKLDCLIYEMPFIKELKPLVSFKWLRVFDSLWTGHKS